MIGRGDSQLWAILPPVEVAKLGHEDLSFSFSLHGIRASAWLEEDEPGDEGSLNPSVAGKQTPGGV